MDYTLIIFAFLILFGYLYLYIGGRYYLRDGFMGSVPTMNVRNNVPPPPQGF